MTDPQTPPGLPDIQSIVTKNWKLFLAEGIVLVLLGIGAIIVPPIAGLAVTLLLGWLFLDRRHFRADRHLLRPRDAGLTGGR